LQQAAAKRLLQRRAARKSLIDFTRFTFPKYRPADNHHLLAEKIEAVLNGDIKRLLVNKPPRHGKSELVSRRAPAFSMGHYPERNIICGAYGADLASDFGEDVRNIIREPAYREVFPGIALSKSSQAKNKWKVTKDGQELGTYLAVGVGSAVTGFGGHLLNLDDPHKDRAEADSERIREKVWKWYVGTAYTRLESDISDDDLPWLWQEPDVAVEEGHLAPYEGAIILTQTRWHEDDLTGRLLEKAEQGGEQWEHLELPALREEDGKIFALWPQKYDVPTLERIKETIGPRDWNSQYQQDPTPEDGTQFKKAYFRNRWKVLPNELNYYMSGDYAVTDEAEGADPDYTCIGVWGVDPSGICYLVDWYISKAEIDEYIETFVEFVKRYKPFWHRAEVGVIRRSIEPSLRKIMAREKAWTTLEWSPTIGDKPAKARGFQVLASNDQIRFPYLMKDAQLILDQLIKFPAGKHDDAVDMCSEFAAGIHKVWEAKKPKEDKKPPKPSNKIILKTSFRK